MASIFSDEDTIKLMTNIIDKWSFYSNSALLINNLKYFCYQSDVFFRMFLAYETTYKKARKEGLTQIDRNGKYTKISLEKLYNLIEDFTNHFKIDIDIKKLVFEKKIVINDIFTKRKNHEISEEEYQNKRFNANTNHGVIYFNYSGDIIDATVLLHEITHLRNQPQDKNKPRTEINDYITESISYAEQFIFCDYLKDLGYQDDYNNYLNDVFFNITYISDKVYFLNKILYVYKEKGNISRDSFISVYKNDKNYEYCLKELCKLITSNRRYITIIWAFLGYISGLYLYILYLEDHNYFSTIEELNSTIQNDKCSWQDIFKILKVNNPNELFKKMHAKIEEFVKNEIRKLNKN